MPHRQLSGLILLQTMRTKNVIFWGGFFFKQKISHPIAYPTKSKMIFKTNFKLPDNSYERLCKALMQQFFREIDMKTSLYVPATFSWNRQG